MSPSYEPHTEDKTFLTVGLTLPGPHKYGPKSEARHIEALLQSNAIDLLHFRKPEVSESYARELLTFLPHDIMWRITLHSHYSLQNSFKFGGMHLKNGIEILLQKDMRISRSCHSVDEIYENNTKFTYSFLSPIFDSLSKPGYKAGNILSSHKLQDVLVSSPVVALGGVTPENFSQLFALKFAGAALLGYLWTQNSIEETITSILEARKGLVGIGTKLI